MYYQSKTLMVLLLMTTMAMGACQKEKESNIDPSTSISPQPTEKNQNTSDDAVAPILVTVLGGHLEQAEKSFLENNMINAAAEINKSAILLEQKYDFASQEDKVDICAAVEDLNAIAKMVNEGKIKSTQELEPVFAQAVQASQIGIDNP